MADVLCPVVLGRDEQLRALDTALGAALAGRGGLVFVTGDAGIGKSRLVRELVGQARAQNMSVVAGRAVPAGASTPYRPLTEAMLQALRDRSLPDDPELAPWLPALGAIVPTVSNARHGETSPPVLGEAVLRLMRWLAQRDGLMVVLEDLHWADPDTLSVLEYLGDNLMNERVLCVATSRIEAPSAAMEFVRRLRGRPGAVHMALDRLEDEHVAEMVRACVPGAEDEVVARVQRTADGIPFLVEEVLASPGVPSSFADSVRARLEDFAAVERLVLDAAAVFGRQFDWTLLPAATGLAADPVYRCLERGVRSQLLAIDGEAFRFRHALTREALIADLLPPRRRDLAAAALLAVEAAHPRLEEPWRDIAADLAVQADDRERAGGLLFASGRSTLDRGALATAVSTLRRAVELLAGSDRRAEAETLLLEALALAGRVEEALAVGERLIAHLADGGAPPAAQADIHVRLAHALVAAARWPAASRHLDAAGVLLSVDPQSPVRARATVLEAEVAFAGDDVALARQLADSVLAVGHASPEVCCHALEIVGRSERFTDLDAARSTFERALATAESAHLEIWRLRALHELGTIDLFDHAGTQRFAEARRVATELGAISTSAVLDLQLAAVFVCRWSLDESDAHARDALAISERLGLGQVRAKALCFLAANHAQRRDREQMERDMALSLAAAPGDAMLEGFAWAGCRGMAALLDDDRTHAIDAFSRGMAILGRLPHAEPAAFRAVWPVLLAAMGDDRARGAIDEARRLAVGLFGMNRGLLLYAEAILAGHSGDPELATDLARAADAAFVNCETWAHLARLLAAEPALTAGWGQPERWLNAARLAFEREGLDALARRCRALVAGPRPSRWAALGITAREADVLVLVARGLANKEIAVQLHVSPRTVEKHVESLLRKTDARSRTHLVAVAGAETSDADRLHQS